MSWHPACCQSRTQTCSQEQDSSPQWLAGSQAFHPSATPHRSTDDNKVNHASGRRPERRKAGHVLRGRPCCYKRRLGCHTKSVLAHAVSSESINSISSFSYLWTSSRSPTQSAASQRNGTGCPVCETGSPMSTGAAWAALHMHSLQRTFLGRHGRWKHNEGRAYANREGQSSA